MRRTVSTDDAPAAVGAYSQATATDNLVFTAGQIPLTPAGDLLDGAGIDVQTEQAMENLEAIGNSVEELDAGVSEVATATDEQAASTEEIAAMVDQTATNATEITEETQDISAAVRQQNRMLLNVSESVEEALDGDDLLDM